MRDKVFIVVEHVMDAFDNILRTRNLKAYRYLLDAEEYAAHMQAQDWDSKFMVQELNITDIH